ncbi:MAG: DNRLRE domain-containing protein [Thermoplasmata archaeon]|nr:DNRLRE domain-containing protein [Thermoplasmata archaeon]
MKAPGRRATRVFAATWVALILGWPAGAAVVTIAPDRDNSLFEGGDNRSCGSGPLFCGATARFGNRRIVIGFDVAGSLPPGSTVTDVELGITVEGAGPSAQDTDVYHVYRLAADWGEQGSACSDGAGALAEPGDATWTDRHFPSDAWSVAGGDFAATASGGAAMPTSGPAAFPSQPGMVADVQSWLDTPSGNFGWIILGNEASSASARQIYSRESTSPPTLRIVFTAPPVPPPAVPDGTTGSAVLLSKLSPDGSQLGVSWDSTSCSGNLDHHIVFGTGSGLPPASSSPYVLAGSVCHLGASSPFIWNGSPDPALLDPGKRLVWMLVVADDGAATEGSWGRATPLQERNGPGLNGSSGQCGIVDKSLANSCGVGF